jgi:hypothetical protein
MGNAESISNIDIGKAINKLSNASENFNKTGDMLLTTTILSDTVSETIHGTLYSAGVALNIMIGVMVLLIVISSIFIFYFMADRETPANLANVNNIITFSLSTAIILSLILIKVAFSGLNMVLFNNMNGLIPNLKKVYN